MPFSSGAEIFIITKVTVDENTLVICVKLITWVKPPGIWGLTWRCRVKIIIETKLLLDLKTLADSFSANNNNNIKKV